MKKNGDTAAGHTEREGIKMARIDGLNEINGAIYDAQVAKYSAESGFEYDRVTIAQKRLLNKMIKKMWLDQDQEVFQATGSHALRRMMKVKNVGKGVLYACLICGIQAETEIDMQMPSPVGCDGKAVGWAFGGCSNVRVHVLPNKRGVEKIDAGAK